MLGHSPRLQASDKVKDGKDSTWYGAAALQKNCVSGKERQAWRRYLAAGLTALYAIAVFPSQALEPQHEYRKYIESAQTLTALSDGLMGDSVSLYNGATEFSVTDIDIPGNSGLPVSLSRRYSVEIKPIGPGEPLTKPILGGVGNWDLDVPYLSGNFDARYSWTGLTANGTTDQRCSSIVQPAVTAPFAVSEIYQGVSVHVPGASDRKMLRAESGIPLPSDGQTYRWTSRERDVFSCIPMQGGISGEGFSMLTAEGVRYDFNVAVIRGAGSMTRQSGAYTVSTVRAKIFLLASKVTDRFGNTVSYQYDGNGHPLSIVSSDDGGSLRRIDFTYSGDRLTTATTNGRTWQYQYDVAGQLAAVVRPDASRWTYTYSGNLTPSFEPFDGGGASCTEGPDALSAAFVLTIGHPSGASGRFDFLNQRHYRAGVQKSECILRNTNGELYYVLGIPNYFDVMSLTRKELSGPGITQPLVWSYDYGNKYQGLWGSGQPAAYPCTTCELDKGVSVLQADGSRQVHRYGILYAANEGRLLRSETLETNGTISRVERTEYLADADTASLPFHPNYGLPTFREDPSTYAVRPVVSKTVEQDGASFTYQVQKTCGSGSYCFDGMANPTLVQRGSSVAPALARVEQIQYSDNLGRWVLGQRASVTCRQPAACAGQVMQQVDFDPATALTTRTYAFGRVLQSLSYFPQGTLQSVSDAKGNAISLSGWKRGLPVSVRFPATDDQPSPVSLSASIDDNGWITATTDEVGQRTCYGYDAMGRNASTTYPAKSAPGVCDQSARFAASQAIEQIGAVEYGLSAGHWRATRSVGNLRQVSYFDAFWRPVVQERYDSDNSSTRSLNVTRFDAAGREAFKSYPVPALSGFGDTLGGVTASYDALGRVVRTVQSSEVGGLTTSIAYLGGFRQQVTDPRGFLTTTAYAAWDVPSTDYPSTVSQPEGAVTDILRDAFGKPLSLRRHDAQDVLTLTRSYVYDGNQLLCKTIEPESGASVMGYDLNGNLTWSASGQGLPSTGGCGLDAVPAAQRVERRYDARNRLVLMQFPDGLGTTQTHYTADGKVASLQTQNSDGQTAITTYDYDSLRNPTAERLQVDGIDWRLGYAYDALGNLAGLTQPNGLGIDYAPNALGQPTRASGYAVAVSYFPNGAIRSFTYGNGIIHSLTQNARQLPERSLDSGGVLDDTYDYDQNGNVLAISDGRSGQRGNRDMRYDGLNRLTQTLSPMFPGGTLYTYDVLDNLTRLKSPGRDYRYSYDERWQLVLVRDAATDAGVIGLQYDVRGNLQNRNGALYQFDLGNRLREATGKERYAYDGHGRRVKASHPTDGAIYSMYGQDGVLRYQLDQRKGKATSYISLGGSLIARVADTVAPPVSQLSLPAFSASGSYTATWTSAAGAMRYELQEQTGTGAFAAVFSGNATSHAISGKPSGVYGYRVRACNPSACGGWSALASTSVTLAPVAAPVVSAPATALQGSYTVSWTAVAGASTYELSESVNTGASWSALYTGAATSQAVNGRPGGSFGYRARGCNSSGCGPWSASVTVQSVVAPVGAPSISVPGSSSGSFDVVWSAVAAASGYALEEAPNAGAWSAFGQIAGTSTQLNRATGSYQYRVMACNAAGCGPRSSTVTTTVLTAPVSAPSLSAPASSSVGTYGVSWSGIATASSYQLVQRFNGGGWTLVFQGDSLGFGAAVGASGAYDYQVRACNGSGCGPYSAVATTQVMLPPPVPVITYNNKTQTAQRPIRILCSVAWSSVENAATYELLTDGAAVRYSGPLTRVSSNTQTYCGTSHQVRACNTAGCSAWSAPPVKQTLEIVSDQ